MIKVEGNDFWRAGVKIGYISNGHIFDHEGQKLGYCGGNNIYDISGRKIGFINGDYIYFVNSSQRIRLEDIAQDVVGGNLSNEERAAARLLLGE